MVIKVYGCGVIIVNNNQAKAIIDPRIGNGMLEAYIRLSIIREPKSNEVKGYLVSELNKQAAKIFGLRSEEALGRSICDVLSLGKDCWRGLRQRLLDWQGEGPFEYQFKRSKRRFMLSPVHLSPDEVLLFFAEITYRRKAEAALRIHEILFNGAQDIILYIDMAGQVVDANERALEAYGYTKKQILNLRIQDIRDPSTLNAFEAQMQRAETEGVIFESIHQRFDGSVFPVEVSARSTDTQSGRLRIHIIRDITERKVQEAKIAWLAKYDGLTGVLNRANFIAELEEELLRASRNQSQIAVLLFDIDKFKSINDCLGHAAGDLVLEQVAKKVQSVLRVGDKIGRFGGDEFVVLQAGVSNREDVLALLARITETLQDPILFQEQKLVVTLSIGVSLFPKDASGVGDLILYADKAMYEKKRGGGHGFSFYGNTL